VAPSSTIVEIPADYGGQAAENIAPKLGESAVVEAGTTVRARAYLGRRGGPVLSPLTRWHPVQGTVTSKFVPG